MNTPRNPFMRGYYCIEVEHVIFISDDHDYQHIYRPLHPSQRHLTNEQIIRHACTFNDEVVFITENQPFSPEIDARCIGTGIVHSAVYALFGHSGEALVHIGDTPSLASAQAIVHDLTFETGFYSRCWEISSAHLPLPALSYLKDRVDNLTPPTLLFEVFRLPSSPALGVKLISTPWNDTHLREVENCTAEQLRLEHRNNDVPDTLADLLHLAAQADIRILVFDADAPVLDGLTVYE